MALQFCALVVTARRTTAMERAKIFMVGDYLVGLIGVEALSLER